MNKRTKIICTLGPSSESPAVIARMIEAGMDCVRLNFSHGTYDQFARIIENVRTISKKLGHEIAIIQDLQGPKIRIGELAAPIQVVRGDSLILSTNNQKNTIPVQYKHLPSDVHAGDSILVNDGLIELKVDSVNKEKNAIKCTVVVGGELSSHRGINVPTASITAPALTAKDKKDAIFGAQHDVDYVALSFVREAKDVTNLRKLLTEHKSRAGIIAKIERHEAIDALEGIIKVSDAIMVARGDLGVEVPAAQVPLLQKRIIRLSNTYGKPVIVATQMLASMTENPRATRAEISDVATAIFDHADAVMLSNETAVGKYPVEATRTLAEVADAVETDMKSHKHLLNLPRPEDMPLVNATCLNATKLAHDINARYIIAVTHSGYTAQEVSKYRSFIPVIVFTSDPHTARQMQLVWGVQQAFVQWIKLEHPLPQIRKTLLANKLAEEGDEIVICNAGFGRKEKFITVSRL